jgi:hypothetical protein
LEKTWFASSIFAETGWVPFQQYTFSDLAEAVVVTPGKMPLQPVSKLGEYEILAPKP